MARGLKKAEELIVNITLELYRKTSVIERENWNPKTRARD